MALGVRSVEGVVGVLKFVVVNDSKSWLVMCAKKKSVANIFRKNIVSLEKFLLDV